MTRHVLDRSRNRRPSLKRALKLLRRSMPNRATLSLQRRARAQAAGRMPAYVRIEKGART